MRVVASPSTSGTIALDPVLLQYSALAVLLRYTLLPVSVQQGDRG